MTHEGDEIQLENSARVWNLEGETRPEFDSHTVFSTLLDEIIPIIAKH
jgi:hypothetical protein